MSIFGDARPPASLFLGHQREQHRHIEAMARMQLERAREQRDAAIRKYTRLEGAVNAHQKADRFKDDHDEALYAVRDKLAAAEAPA